MAKDEKLAALQVARQHYKMTLAEIEADLDRLRQERIAAATALCEGLVVEARAEGASWVEIKRAYGTTDHRTVTDIVDRNAERLIAHATVVEQRASAAENAIPAWLEFRADGTVVIEGVVFEIATVGDGDLMLYTNTPLWNEDFTVRNEIVNEFDGHIEADGARAAEVFHWLPATGETE